MFLLSVRYLNIFIIVVLKAFSADSIIAIISGPFSTFCPFIDWFAYWVLDIVSIMLLSI